MNSPSASNLKLRTTAVRRGMLGPSIFVRPALPQRRSDENALKADPPAHPERPLGSHPRPAAADSDRRTLVAEEAKEANVAGTNGGKNKRGGSSGGTTVLGGNKKRRCQ